MKVDKRQKEYMEKVVKIEKLPGQGRRHQNGRKMANLWLLTLDCGHQVTRHAGVYWNHPRPQAIYCTICDKAGIYKNGMHEDLLPEQSAGS